MKSPYHFYLILLCGLLTLATFIPKNGLGQQRIIDSLRNQLSHPDQTGSEHERILSLVRLSDALATDDLAAAFRKNAAALAVSLQNKDLPAASFALSSRVALLARAGQTDLADKTADSAIDYARNAPDWIRGLAWFKKGYIQNIQNNPDQARQSWSKALALLHGKAGTLYRANIYYLIYGIYAERNDTAQSGVYARLALQDALQSGDPGMTTAAWQINGSYSLDQFNNQKDSVKLRAAVQAFSNAVSVFRANRSSIKNQSIVVLPALNLADIYLDYYPPWYRDSVIRNVNLSLEVSGATGNITMQANCYDIISKLHLREGDLHGAEQALLREKAITDSIRPPNYYLSMNLYQSLAALKEKQGNAAAALVYYKQFLDFYKKEFNQQQYQTIQQLEAKYQNEKKDKALQLLAQKNTYQKRQMYLYIGIALVAIFGLLFLFMANHFRLKYSLQREQLKDEEAARLLAEQKLIQSQKEQLQKEVLAGSMQVEHKNELLQQLKEKLSVHADGSTVRQLERILHEETRMDEDFEQDRSAFKDIHPDFFAWLEQKATQKLTQLDFRYAAYIYMKLSSKQIAALLHVEPKSVRMAKYRLKQKLGLGKEDELDAVIANWRQDIQ